jgi:hypothetical protein
MARPAVGDSDAGRSRPLHAVRHLHATSRRKATRQFSTSAKGHSPSPTSAMHTTFWKRPMNAVTFKALRRLGSLALLVCLAMPVGAQVAPPLGQAEGFAVLGATAVSNTGATVIDGDVGIWPNTASSITGFPPGVVNGTVHAGDAVAQQAQTDLITAYDFVAGQACDQDLTGQDLGGLVLNPGIYCFADSAQLTGTLTLDSLGDGAAVYIFKIGSTLTTASNARVELVNGGSPCNIFWQVGSSATLGTTSVVEGNILALTSITATTGASITGRALARNGAVTLDTNTVTVCADCPSLELAPVTLPNGGLGVAYSQMVVATQGTSPYSYSVSSGSLPTGLVLSPATGEISGIPSATGSFTFTVSAVDSIACFGERVYTIVINDLACPSILVSPASLPAAQIGEAYAQAVSASGGAAPYVFSISAGSLPPGLMLAAGGPADALLTGTPTTEGSYTFTVTAADANGCLGARTYSIVVQLAAVCPSIVLLPSSIGNIIANRPYSQSFTASGGTGPYVISLSAGVLPAGLSLSGTGPDSALVSGTTQVEGNFAFSLTATDANDCAVTNSYAGDIRHLPEQITIPTLSNWGLWAMLLLLPLIGFVALRR